MREHRSVARELERVLRAGCAEAERCRPHERPAATLKDGSFELKFGPADLGEAAAWVASWLPGVEVLGDARLIAKLRDGRR